MVRSWRPPAALGALVALVAACAPAVRAAEPPPPPPANDGPYGAGVFETYQARHGVPAELDALAALAGATPDRWVPRCLGPSSFARTVWYRIPPAPAPREITVDASGRTLSVVDLAVFVQNGDVPRITMPNACAGAGLGGADAAPDAASAITVRIPALRGLLVQVGRRGAPGPVADEEAIVVMRERALSVVTDPAGDLVGPRTPKLPRSGAALVGLGGATTTEEDPADPDCPAMGGVWRRVLPKRSGRLLVTASGRYASSLSVYRGSRPTLRNAQGCVDREGAGTLAVPVVARAHRSLWIRVGADRAPAGARARLAVAPAAPGARPSGGAPCLSGLAPRVRGGLVSSPLVKVVRRGRTMTLGLDVRGGPICAPVLTLVDARDRVLARGRPGDLADGRRLVPMLRLRRPVAGRYRLRVDALGIARMPVRVPSSVTATLRRR